jgi:membrane-bound metal-dependent hydrolase YbcI (DUF457 family)
MAGFKTHITTSALLGVGYGAAGHYLWGFSPATCVLSAGLCGVAGMLPDVDSDSGVPLRESLAFGSAVIPMLMLHRFEQLGLSRESMVLAGAALYLAIRFGVGEFIRRYTVHRGMFHSIPAMLIVGLLGYLICSDNEEIVRCYKAGALMVGFLSHLALDEIYSVDLRNVKIKKTFGTALKFWGESWLANVSCYAKLLILSALAFGDPVIMGRLQNEIQSRGLQFERTAKDAIQGVWR